MIEKALVSVIIPVYNMEGYLSGTLDSVLASDYTNLEVVLMDDGSSDRSYEIARKYAEKDSRVRVYVQDNAGVIVARNNAIALAKGEFIYPLDADDLLHHNFLSQAVAVLEEQKDVKVVSSKDVFCGDKQGEWKLPEFSLSLLACKNMIPVSALYRKEDWERVGGYCQEIIAREDWEFWISMLKDGGRVVKLPQIGFYYRIRSTSKRITDRSLKKHVIDVLNKRHPEFFERELGGPLRYQRSLSKCINRLNRFFYPRRIFVSPEFLSLDSFVKVLPIVFKNGGKTIYKGRNELKEFERIGKTLIVKSYRLPHFVNRIVYNLFRASKACRSYRYAKLLHNIGVGTPTPVGYYSTGSWLLFGESYFVSLKSDCPYTYRDLVNRTFEHQEEILRAIARTTGILHEHGCLHKDYSSGNILFKETLEGVQVEIIDLNRMRFGKVSMEDGCKNFERLPGTEEMFAILADEYARVRGFDVKQCLTLIRKRNECNK